MKFARVIQMEQIGHADNLTKIQVFSLWGLTYIMA